MMMLAGAVPSQIVILRQVINLSFFLDNCNAVDHLHSFIWHSEAGNYNRLLWHHKAHTMTDKLTFISEMVQDRATVTT